MALTANQIKGRIKILRKQLGSKMVEKGRIGQRWLVAGGFGIDS